MKNGTVDIKPGANCKKKLNFWIIFMYLTVKNEVIFLRFLTFQSFTGLAMAPRGNPKK